MNYLELSHSLSTNIGDEVQAVAASRLLPPTAGAVDRDFLSDYEGPSAAFLWSCWYSWRPHSWQPTQALEPIPMGLHLTPETLETIARDPSYLKRCGPIGCRDPETARALERIGIRSFVSYCVTTTLEPRMSKPTDGVTVLVDVKREAVPAAIRRNSIRISHRVAPGLSHATKMAYARDLLELYRTRASLVVTTRLHCALPCTAMGIPVVFFGNPGHGRTAILRDLGLPIHDRRLYSRALGGLPGRLLNRINWRPEPPDISQVGAAFRARVCEAVERLESGKPAYLPS